MPIFIRQFLLLFLITASIITSAASAQDEVVDSICAIVDNQMILESEVAYGVNALLLEQNLRYPSAEQFSQMRETVIQAYITQKILLSKAEEETLNVEDRTVDKEMEKKLEAMIQQAGSKEKLAEYFGRPFAQVKTELWQSVKDGLMIEMMKQMHIGLIYVRRNEVAELYKERFEELPIKPAEVSFSHILLSAKPSAESRERAFSKINDVLELLKKGADFDSLAVVYSEDGSASDGGHIGWTDRGDLVPEFEEVAYELEPGEISGMVESRFGFHIIRLVERQGERISTQHILVQLNPTEDDWVRIQHEAEAIKARILNGEDFGELAKQFSDDEASAKNGGKLAPVALEELAPEFSNVIQPMSEGDIGAPFRTPFGWHILRLDKKSDERKLSLEEDWASLEQLTLAIKREEKFKSWVEELKKSHYIWPEIYAGR